MNAMTHSDYERGWDAAQRALDRTGLNASELLAQTRAQEDIYRRQESHQLAEWNKGYADAVQEFLSDRSDI